MNSLAYRDSEHKLNSDGSPRIAVIGDSITYGTGVRIEDTYHQKLEKFLNEREAKNYNNAEVIAFNNGAVSTQWAMETYMSNVRQFSPDLVILGFCLNDLADYEMAAPKKTVKKAFYDVLAYSHIKLRHYSHLYFLVFERSRRFIYQHLLDRTVRTQNSWMPMQPSNLKFKETYPRALKSTSRLLEQFKDLVHSDGAEFLVVIFPFEMQISKELAQIYADEYSIRNMEEALAGVVQRDLIQELSKIQVKHLNLLPFYSQAFSSSPDQELFFRELGGMLDWAHPNARGHEVAGQAIYDYLN